ncbi:MAG: hypothetical protein ACK2U5_21955 [Candidatus Promineifilaceae bacterium]
MTRRLAYIVVIFFWLLLMSIPFFMFSLAARQQLQVGPAEDNHIRVFLIQERDAEGIGLEIARAQANAPGCTQTSVRYFMWKGEPENVVFCSCVDMETGDTLPASPGACRSN